LQRLPSNEPQASPAQPAAVTDGERAFRAVLALRTVGAAGFGAEAANGAAARAEIGAEAGAAIGVDAAGNVIAVSPDDERGLLVLGADGWRPVAHAAAESRAVLDLYLPIRCHPGALTVAHLGQSLDGQIATATGDSYYVTGSANLLHLQRMRALCGTVVVGAGTIAADDPRLTVRLDAGRQPVRVVLDPNRRLGADKRVFQDGAAPTLLIADEARVGRGERHGQAEVVGIPSRSGRLVLPALLDELHRRGLRSIFIEGGGTTVSRFLEADLLDRLHVAVAPLVIGSGRPGLGLPGRDHIGDCRRSAHRVFRMGNDVLIDCDLRRPPNGAAAGPELVRVL